MHSDCWFYLQLSYLLRSGGFHNRLQSVVDAVAPSSEDWDAEDTEFGYDANGNVVFVKENGSYRFRHIAYNPRNLPLFVEQSDYSNIIYLYDANGQRTYKKVGAQSSEHYILDGDRTVAVFENGAVKYWNILANGVVGRRDAAGNKFYYLKDHLGSTRAVVNAAGNVKEALDYYPYGLLMPGHTYQSGSETKEKFTGKELDAETGLNYHGGRFYWLAGGRWFVVDPLMEKYPSLSLYQYSFNNPILFFDPNGLEPILVSKLWYIFTPHEYLSENEKTQWYNRLETAKLYYYNMGYSGIAEWISNKDFEVIIYNYYGIESDIGGKTNRSKNRIYIGNTSSQETINLVYAHELAHLIGYSEVGAYATSAALLGSSSEHYIMKQLIKYVRSNPQSYCFSKKFPIL